MFRHPKAIAAAAANLVLSALLGACGGGGDSTTPPPPVATTVSMSGVAADGPLQGATAWYDLNDNGLRDAGEPSAVTDANGRFTFEVAIAEAGRHRVVVDVPATAVDKDTGTPIGSAFTLVAPATGSASQVVFASPLTTLVQAHIDGTGVSLAEATAFIQSQAGLTISPLADYTAASTADNKTAANVAKLVLLTTSRQASAVASVVGTVDLGGTKITAADVAKAVADAVVAALPGLAAAAADPVVASASGAALQTALASAADAVVAQAGVTASGVAAAIGVARLPADNSTAPPAAGATLSAFAYTDANNWFTRTLEASAADNTPDASNLLRYYSVYRQSQSSSFSPNGVVHAWGTGNSLNRSGDRHWNGSAWVDCPLGTRSMSSKRDAQGRSTYEFCQRREEGATRRVAVDISGQSIASVFANKIRTFPGGANGVDYANWGPSDPAAFGGATFPAGAKLFYQTNTVTKAAFVYDVQPTAVVGAYTPAVAAGGDARNGGTPACAQVTSANFATFRSPVTTLEDLVARNLGAPCVFNMGSNSDGTSLVPNEWWGNSTVSIGTVSGSQSLPAGTTNYYSTTGDLRVGFAASGNGVTFYHCLRRRVDGSPRNCSSVGTGTYATQTVGDARVMTFSAQPALAQRLTYVRVFVERGGSVHFGYTSRPGATDYLRLNLEATNAVFAQLGLPPVRPVTRASDFNAATAAALATAKGVWFANLGTDVVAVVRVGDGGRFLLGQGVPDTGREQTGGELGYLDIDTLTGKVSTLLEVDSDLTGGTSHPNPTDALTITPTQLISSDGVTFTRLGVGSTGIVGLWAVGSATDFATNHFAFLPNGKVLHIDSQGDTSPGPCLQARQGPPGGEYASYTFDAATGALRVFGKIYDTNGCAGLFDSSPGGVANTELNGTVVFAADGNSAVFTGPDGSNTLYRIASQ